MIRLSSLLKGTNATSPAGEGSVKNVSERSAPRSPMVPPNTPSLGNGTASGKIKHDRVKYSEQFCIFEFEDEKELEKGLPAALKDSGNGLGSEA